MIEFESLEIGTKIVSLVDNPNNASSEAGTEFTVIETDPEKILERMKALCKKIGVPCGFTLERLSQEGEMFMASKEVGGFPSTFSEHKENAELESDFAKFDLAIHDGK